VAQQPKLFETLHAVALPATALVPAILNDLTIKVRS
jgi:hypothetical protein